MKKVSALITLMLTLATLACADVSLAGKWRGETRNQAVLVLELSLKGETLTGTLTRNDVAAEIKEGKVSAQTFTFKATLNDRTEQFSGELAKDQLQLWMDRQGRESAIVLKPVKG